MLRIAILATLMVGCAITPGGAGSTPTLAGPTAVPATDAPTSAPTVAATAVPQGTPSGSRPSYDDPYDDPYNYGPRPTANPSPAAGDGSTVATAESAEHGTYLVGPDGLALYVFAHDHAGMSMCVNECIANWPPLLAEDGQLPEAGEGVDGEFTTIARSDGSMQVAYDGAALYFYAADQAPGDTNGHGVNDVWLLASP